MPKKKEIGSKLRKKILLSILAPGIPSKVLTDNIQFIAEDEAKSNRLLYNRKYEVRFFQHGKLFLPTIQFIRENKDLKFPIVNVDQGAVQYILNGADIFAQGVNSVNDFDANSIVLVSNPQNAIMAVGESLKPSFECKKGKGKGKVILNLHYLGDKIWDGEL